MVFTWMVNELALSTAQVRSMVFTWMVNELALSTAQVRSMLFPCMVNELALSTAQVRSMAIFCGCTAWFVLNLRPGTVKISFLAIRLI